MESLYGMHDDTLDSLMLSLLPPVGFQEFLETDKPQKDDEIPQNIKGRDVEVFLVRRLLRALRKQAGFRLPHVSVQYTYTCTINIYMYLILIIRFNTYYIHVVCVKYT